MKNRLWILAAFMLVAACGKNHDSSATSVPCSLSDATNTSPVYLVTNLDDETLSPCDPSGRHFQVLVIANDKPSGLIGNRADGSITALIPIPKDQLSAAERYATAAMQGHWRPLSDGSPAFEGCALTCTIAFAYGKNVVRVSYDANVEFEPSKSANIVRNATLLLAEHSL